MSRIEGGWWAAAAGMATLARILLLDAGRRVATAGRGPPARAGAPPT
ncbi:MAG: hypothetical protein ACRDTD_08055 [Pseudonocardiaceae bacterium]